MITLTVLFLATVFLAYSNGANDNFKGVATLFDPGEANRRVVSGILMSWLLTLPIAAIISAVAYAVVVRI
jgi:PiT family inorganic phosphate transporter